MRNYIVGKTKFTLIKNGKPSAVSQRQTQTSNICIGSFTIVNRPWQGEYTCRSGFSRFRRIVAQRDVKPFGQGKDRKTRYSHPKGRRYRLRCVGGCTCQKYLEYHKELFDNKKKSKPGCSSSNTESFKEWFTVRVQAFGVELTLARFIVHLNQNYLKSWLV